MACLSLPPPPPHPLNNLIWQRRQYARGVASLKFPSIDGIRVRVVEFEPGTAESDVSRLSDNYSVVDPGHDPAACCHVRVRRIRRGERRNCYVTISLSLFLPSDGRTDGYISLAPPRCPTRGPNHVQLPCSLEWTWRRQLSSNEH